MEPFTHPGPARGRVHVGHPRQGRAAAAGGGVRLGPRARHARAGDGTGSARLRRGVAAVHGGGGRAGAALVPQANAHDPHRPYSGGQDELDRFPAEARASYPAPSKVFGPADDVGGVPGFLPDLPEVAREYREYLSSSRRCDDVVAEVLRALEEAGAAGDTLVVFLSDNGIAVPFAKENCYLQSSRTPLIVRWLGVTLPGRREDAAFVSMIDLFPTFCAAAGLPEPAGLDGRTLLPLLHADPHSLADLSGDPDRRKDLDAARRDLLAWMAGTGDPLLDTYRAYLQGAMARNAF
ncbi:sulfatase-like hydrolase/transferase [Nonomuraea jabiensis]|uniref:sulfatase-like hydrolase/transferase n=1 Tax=Nonomuraea jabiensis TaxID=882448 RepID=UPI00369D956A